MPAIRTIEDIKNRCVVDEITGCWNWRGGMSQGGNGATPIPAARFHVYGRPCTVSVILHWLVKGKDMPAGMTFAPSCENPRCANPDHRKLRVRGSVSMPPDPLRIAKITLTQRSKSRLSDADIDDIRYGGLSAKEAAEKHNVDTSFVYGVRRGIRRKPLVGTSASVFSWRP